jgi:hypothetical protein
MVVVQQKLAEANPAAIEEIHGCCSRPRQRPGCRKQARSIFLPFGFTARRPALQTVVNYALQQSLISREIDVAKLFDANTLQSES